MTPLSEKKKTLNVYFFLTVDLENVQPPPPVIKFACCFRAVRVCLEIGDRLPHDGISSEWYGISSEWFTSKPASRIV